MGRDPLRELRHRHGPAARGMEARHRRPCGIHGSIHHRPPRQARARDVRRGTGAQRHRRDRVVAAALPPRRIRPHARAGRPRPRQGLLGGAELPARARGAPHGGGVGRRAGQPGAGGLALRGGVHGGRPLRGAGGGGRGPRVAGRRSTIRGIGGDRPPAGRRGPRDRRRIGADLRGHPDRGRHGAPRPAHFHRGRAHPPWPGTRVPRVQRGAPARPGQRAAADRHRACALRRHRRGAARRARALRPGACASRARPGAGAGRPRPAHGPRRNLSRCRGARLRRTPLAHAVDHCLGAHRRAHPATRARAVRPADRPARRPARGGRARHRGPGAAPRDPGRPGGVAECRALPPR